MTARISLNLGRTGVIDRPCSQSIFFRWAKLQRAEVLSENPGIFLIVEALVLRLLYEENFRVVIPIHSGGIHRWHFESTQARICKGSNSGVGEMVACFLSKKGR